ncbi:MAG: response regulator [Planctomycetes bacterium]|nr:response regulator [Planctomycetota bacterium]
MLSDSKLRVLLVDDDEMLVEMLADFITTELQAEVTAAGDAVTATEYIREFPGEYDLTLIDMNLPGGRGVDIAQEMATLSPTTLIFLMSGGTEMEELIDALNINVEGFLRKPFTLAELRNRLKHGVQRRKNMTTGWRKLEEFERRAAARERTMIRAQQTTLLALAKLAENKDPETGKHVERVGLFCGAIARELASLPEYSCIIDDDWIRNISMTSQLHDIGKVGIPDAVLLKPGKLTEAEFDVMKRHTVIGASVMESAIETLGEDSDMLNMAYDVVRHHHERFDGGGYPDGLTGLDIPLAARIVTVVDNYDALRSKRVYKPAFSQRKTTVIMKSNTGNQFDPIIIKALYACEGEINQIAMGMSEDEVDWEDDTTNAKS